MTGLVVALLFLIVLSGFFSAAETSMMAINRYRLRHLVKQKNRVAIRTQKLLEHPDRLLGTVLIGNNIANISASAITTIIAEHLYGNIGIALGAGILTFVLLVFSEVAPKTLAAIYPERCAFIFSLPLTILLKILYPVIWLVNFFANALLRLFGFKVKGHLLEHLTLEELRTLIHEAGSKIPASHQEMLLRILDLGKITVDNVMLPRSEIQGIDITAPWEKIMDQINDPEYTRLPVYAEDINQLQGILDVSKSFSLLKQEGLTKEKLLKLLSEPYFIPEGTFLNTQLLNFRKVHLHMGLVVDEYGEVIGLITLEDIIEEIVGDLDLRSPGVTKDVQQLSDGSYLVSGNISVRELNRIMHWHLDTEGPRTLSGLITESLEMIPQVGISLRISHYPMEIMEVKGKTVKTVKIFPDSSTK